MSESFAVSAGDVINVNGQKMVVEQVDHHNHTIRFKSGYEIHGAAIHSDDLTYIG